MNKAPRAGVVTLIACAAILAPAATASFQSDPSGQSAEPAVGAQTGEAAAADRAGASQASRRSGPRQPIKRVAFRKYVACDTVVEAEPSRSCRLGDEKGAFFRSNLFHVRYHVCVRFPDKRSMCAKRQEARRGELYVNRITSRMPGVHAVAWFVKGKRVGLFRFRVTR